MWSHSFGPSFDRDNEDMHWSVELSPLHDSGYQNYGMDVTIIIDDYEEYDRNYPSCPT